MKTKLSQKDFELLNTSRIEVDTTNPEYSYLFPNFDASESGVERDYVEAHIFDTSENFIENIIVDKKLITKDINNKIIIKTGTLLRRSGYDRGRYIVKYNFLRKLAGDTIPILIDNDGLLFNEPIDTGSNGNVTIESDGRIFTRGDSSKELFLKDNKYFLHEISDSRKEVRLVTQQIKNDKYLRDFFNLQKETKLIGSLGSSESHLQFFDPTNAADNADTNSTSLKFVAPNAEPFRKNIIGGAIEIPNAFITRFEARSQLDDSTLGGGPDEEFYDSEDTSIFIPSFLLNLDPAKTETGTILANRDDNKFAKIKSKIIPGASLQIAGQTIPTPSTEILRSMSTDMDGRSEVRLVNQQIKNRSFLDLAFGKFTIKTVKNKKITLSSNSTLRNVGRTYRWTIGGYERTRKHESAFGVKHSYYWSYTQLNKSNVTITPHAEGGVNGLSFQGDASQAKDLVITINNNGCFLDISLEIELEEGSRFTESIFLPRAISTKASNVK